MREKSRMSLMIASSECDESLINCRYFTVCGLPSLFSNWSNSQKPMMPVNGVRSSWLVMARNADFARLADSASALACDNACKCIRRRLSSCAVTRITNSLLSRCGRMLTSTACSPPP